MGTTIALVFGSCSRISQPIVAGPAGRSASVASFRKNTPGCLAYSAASVNADAKSPPPLSTIAAPSDAMRPRFTGLQFVGKKILAAIPNCFAAYATAAP